MPQIKPVTRAGTHKPRRLFELPCFLACSYSRCLCVDLVDRVWLAARAGSERTAFAVGNLVLALGDAVVCCAATGCVRFCLRIFLLSSPSSLISCSGGSSIDGCKGLKLERTLAACGLSVARRCFFCVCPESMIVESVITACFRRVCVAVYCDRLSICSASRLACTASLRIWAEYACIWSCRCPVPETWFKLILCLSVAWYISPPFRRVPST